MADSKDLSARLERVEERAKELNLAFAWQASRPSEAASTERERQAQTLATLRQDLQQAQAGHAQQMQALQAELREAKAQVPAMLQAAIAAGGVAHKDSEGRHTANLQNRFREQFDAAVEEHVAARTRLIATQLSGSQSALAELEKQAAANAEQLKTLRQTFANLTLEAARVPMAAAESTESSSWRQSWRLPALLAMVLVLSLVAWQAWQRTRGAAAVATSEAALLDQAGEAAVQKDYPRAEGLYREVLQKNPKQEEAMRGLGNALLLESESVMHTLPPP